MNEMAQTIGLRSREELIAQMVSGDKSHDGTFIVGVRTTGIYCLPSCRARKPLPQNVVFFDREADALAFGLRACRKCRPDNFYRNVDPDKDALQNLAAQIKAAPEKWNDVAELTQASGVGTTKLFGLFRQHFQTTPLQWVRGVRIDAACDAFTMGSANGSGVAEVAFSLGYESLSAFHAQFRAETGLAPGQFRDWVRGKVGDFTLAVSPFGWDYAHRIHCRDANSFSERAEGQTAFVKAFVCDGQAALLHLERHEDGNVRCCVHAASVTPLVRRAAHRVALRLLGLESGGNASGEQTAWEKKADADPVFARLMGNRRGLRVPLTADVWESVAWAIIGQQINLSFAYTLRRAVVERAGSLPMSGGLTPFPPAPAVAALDYDDLTARQFSRRKAEYLLDTARAVATGTLCLDTLQSGRGTPFGDAEKTLLALRGLGPWSAHYVLMRGGGWPDCMPIGDTGITAGLRKLYDLDHAPDKDEAARLMEPFTPFRSLATHHLWASLGGED